MRYVGDVQQLFPTILCRWAGLCLGPFYSYIYLGTPAKVGDVGGWDENVTDQKRGE